jgi:glycosyltransferase involved in cell wall biosynthesis
MVMHDEHFLVGAELLPAVGRMSDAAGAGCITAAGDRRRAQTISVLIPTYRRPHELHRCFGALAAQTRRPDDVVVVVRDVDQETRTYLAARDALALPVRVVTVVTPGVVAAMNAGLDAIEADIIACTDDDAAPRPNWLAMIEWHFLQDERIAGVGGRDWIVGSDRVRAVVGRVQWWGRAIGEHHCGVGPARDVDILKGVNMSFRRSSLAHRRFDTRLLGSGATVHFELSMALALRRAGWRLIYDPAVIVDHHQAPRVDEAQRSEFSPRALHDAVHNETLALLEYLPAARRHVFIAWAFAVGTRGAPGLIQWLRFIATRQSFPTRRLLASWQGRLSAWRRWRAEQGLSRGVG